MIGFNRSLIFIEFRGIDAVPKVLSSFSKKINYFAYIKWTTSSYLPHAPSPSLFVLICTRAYIWFTYQMLNSPLAKEFSMSLFPYVLQKRALQQISCSFDIKDSSLWWLKTEPCAGWLPSFFSSHGHPMGLFVLSWVLKTLQQQNAMILPIGNKTFT